MATTQPDDDTQSFYMALVGKAPGLCQWWALPMAHFIDWIAASQGYFKDLGAAGLLLYVGLYAAVQLAVVIPASPIAMGAGLIFGLGWGYGVVTLGSTLGLMMNFLLARYLARRWVAERLGRNEKFRLIDRAVGEKGWRIVALLRFCPIPFGLANYCFGLTAVRFLPYTLASVVAIALPNFFFTYLGATAGTSLQALTGQGRPKHPAEYVMLGLGIVAGLVALAYIGRTARQAVAQTQG